MAKLFEQVNLSALKQKAEQINRRIINSRTAIEKFRTKHARNRTIFGVIPVALIFFIATTFLLGCVIHKQFSRTYRPI